MCVLPKRARTNEPQLGETKGRARALEFGPIDAKMERLVSCASPRTNTTSQDGKPSSSCWTTLPSEEKQKNGCVPASPAIGPCSKERWKAFMKPPPKAILFQ